MTQHEEFNRRWGIASSVVSISDPGVHFRDGSEAEVPQHNPPAWAARLAPREGDHAPPLGEMFGAEERGVVEKGAAESLLARLAAATSR